VGLVLITHDLGIVARIATRVLVMYAGQIVESGPVERVFRAPGHPYTRGLLSCIPVPGRGPRAARLGTIPGMVPSLVGRMPGCHFASRCAHVTQACRTGSIPLARHAGADHAVRCVRAGELAQAAESKA
jgi:peptide/nickel transport system ATP-binding protein